MSKTLTDDDFESAAYRIGCDVAAVKAVADVESSGEGFLSDGRAKILFEGHIFYKYTRGKYSASNPTVCYTPWTKKYYLGGLREYDRLKEAEGLDQTAARLSASYGKFQIMGFNFPHCGYRTVDDFYEAMQLSEAEHLSAFLEYVRHANLDEALKEHNWARFARGYNGPEYWKNSYDKKIEAAYLKHAQNQP